PDAAQARLSSCSCSPRHRAVRRTSGQDAGPLGSARSARGARGCTSSQDTDSAPASSSASERRSPSGPRTSRISAVKLARSGALSRRIAFFLLRKLLLEVVDIDPSPDDPGVQQQFLMQWDVGLYPLDD